MAVGKMIFKCNMSGYEIHEFIEMLEQVVEDLKGGSQENELDMGHKFVRWEAGPETKEFTIRDFRVE